MPTRRNIISQALGHAHTYAYTSIYSGDAWPELIDRVRDFWCINQSCAVVNHAREHVGIARCAARDISLALARSPTSHLENGARKWIRRARAAIHTIYTTNSLCVSWLHARENSSGRLSALSPANYIANSPLLSQLYASRAANNGLLGGGLTNKCGALKCARHGGSLSRDWIESVLTGRESETDTPAFYLCARLVCRFVISRLLNPFVGVLVAIIYLQLCDRGKNVIFLGVLVSIDMQQEKSLY